MILTSIKYWGSHISTELGISIFQKLFTQFRKPDKGKYDKVLATIHF